MVLDPVTMTALRGVVSYLGGKSGDIADDSLDWLSENWLPIAGALATANTVFWGSKRYGELVGEDLATEEKP